MLIKKLPTEVSPPKLSIHWSTPWPNETYAERQILDNIDDELGHYGQRAIYKSMGRRKRKIEDIQENAIENFKKIPLLVDPAGWGFEPNWAGAVKIHYKGEDIRVFPHEFSQMDLAKMTMYILGEHNEDPSHLLQTDTEVGIDIQEFMLDMDMRDIRDAALLDGCSMQAATLVAIGQDVTDELTHFEPIGWYRCRPEYAQIYCHDWEMEE